MVLKNIFKLSCNEKIDLIFFIIHLAALKTGPYDSELMRYPTAPLYQIKISFLYIMNDFFLFTKNRFSF